MKTNALLISCLVATLAALSASAARAQVTSTFDADADGWTHAPGGDPGTTLTYAATGGNPGGRVVLTDAGQGVSDFFQAPAKFTGDDSGFLDGSFSFDLMDDSSIDSLSDALTLTDAAGDTLTHTLPSFASGSYVSFSFTLNETGGWTFTPFGAGGSAATRMEFQTVLANVSSLVIPGDFHNGTEMTSLDNVALRAVPEPGTWALLLAGTGLLVGTIRARRRFGF